MSVDESVVERLRASKDANDRADRKRGDEKGRSWASESAESSELEGLQAFRDAFDGHSSLTFEDFFTLSDEDREHSHAGHPFSEVPGAVNPENTSHRDAVGFWDGIGVDSRDQGNNLFLLGFVEGALEVWDEVKGRL